MKTDMDKPRVPALALTVEDACLALSMSKETFRSRVMPEIRIVRLGRRKVIPVRELERWLDQHGEAVGDDA